MERERWYGALAIAEEGRFKWIKPQPNQDGDERRISSQNISHARAEGEVALLHYTNDALNELLPTLHERCSQRATTYLTEQCS